ncbi:hypothetical protein NC651_004197 [Populus alba x Populus x berolinensis]|nr:hypothetical protein NC651_004197 [Populus alba x Populus x berolinensis]
MNFFIHDRLLAFLAGVLIISTVAVWKTGTSPSRILMPVLLATLIVVLHLHLHLHLPFHHLF